MIPEHRPTRLPVFLASALSKIYSIGINHRNGQFDKGVGVTRFDRHVISIGNLSTGGTGKTPLVQHVVRTLINAGHQPAIAMRGYKAQPGQPSDEQREHMDALPDVSIVAQPNRIAGLEALFATDEGAAVDCVVLDDGFQHRKIARNLDIVVIDASRPPQRDALLPLGFLRESVESLVRADVVVISHAEMVEQEQLGEVRRWVDGQIEPGTAVAVVEHQWGGLSEYSPDSEIPIERPLEHLDGLAVAVISAIGHPDAFVSMAEQAGASIVHRCDRPDHDNFPDEILQEFIQQSNDLGADAILTTRKDWTKLESTLPQSALEQGLLILVPSLSIGFRSGKSELESRIKTCSISNELV